MGISSNDNEYGGISCEMPAEKDQSMVDISIDNRCLGTLYLSDLQPPCLTLFGFPPME
jgi:hypothetical protein